MTMIDGMTVLSEEIYGTPIPTIPVIILLVFGWSGLLNILHVGFTHGEIRKGLVSAIAPALVMLIATIVFFHLASLPSEQVVYKVVVDDSTSFKEFTARYEIIEQDGEVYTIIDKTENDGE